MTGFELVTRDRSTDDVVTSTFPDEDAAWAAVEALAPGWAWVMFRLPSPVPIAYGD